jgi:SDR family mycofactocin-dependent oxidoreductase
MGRLTGKVAFVTGAARGQGRSHATRLAEEGADIIAIDIAAPLEGLAYQPATSDDLAETVRRVEALDRRIVARQADVRDFAAVQSAVEEGIAELGGLDIVVANAGISGHGRSEELSEYEWTSMIDINLTGVWHSAKAAIPHLKAQRSGVLVFTSSIAGLKPLQNLSHYTAAKHGVVGLMKTLALELAPYSIRVNTVNPGNVDTYMTNNADVFALFRPELPPDQLTQESILPHLQQIHALPVPLVDPVDISNAVLFLVSDEARYITGVTLPVDAGALVK